MRQWCGFTHKLAVAPKITRCRQRKYVMVLTLGEQRSEPVTRRNRLVSAILRRKVPINTLRMWALRFRAKLLVRVEDCLENWGARRHEFVISASLLWGEGAFG